MSNKRWIQTVQYQSESSKGGVATADLITSEEGDQQCLVKF